MCYYFSTSKQATLDATFQRATVIYFGCYCTCHIAALIFVVPYLQKAHFPTCAAPNSVCRRHTQTQKNRPSPKRERERKVFPAKNRVIALLSLRWAQEQECTFPRSADFFSLVHTNCTLWPFCGYMGN